ncbi:LUD domain-containing protein [Streptomyces sp. ST2-7A]|uniref:LutC/YkgG family protein n=1 Tax=Streptomyces sp. ST2-7A TaxID=2907214 RepID=UPI001F3238C7|nr:LUD domain-containing protein [Streptomyces sp. ST2-7A]MCE7079310.1 LUD domain-containing protein [Streptomyces sp. ST2-7A]
MTGCARGTGTGHGSREVVLGRVRRALRGTGTGPAEPAGPRAVTPVPREYLVSHLPEAPDRPAALTDLLAENLADYRALVHRVDPDGLPALIARLLTERGARSVVAPPGVPDAWLPEGVVRVPDDPAGTAAELDAVDAVVTGCALAIAETGTIVLDGSPDQGRRRITLIPDHHLCVVRVPEQVVSSVPEALPRLVPHRPQTWISGPSATSDIELDRVEGVHGPRVLEVLLVGPLPGPAAPDAPGPAGS